MEKNKKQLFDFILLTPELLSQNYVSIDLFNHLDNNTIEMYPYNVRELLLLQECPNIISYLKSGYEIEIREKRHLTILVDEWTRIKRDIKIYQIENENRR